jgi:uncharacterized protein YktA (UPF0223 family)
MNTFYFILFVENKITLLLFHVIDSNHFLYEYTIFLQIINIKMNETKIISDHDYL